jgi:hypothetical protein
MGTVKTKQLLHKPNSLTQLQDLIYHLLTPRVI